MPRCRNCGADIGNNSICPYCGYSVVEAKKIDEERQERIARRNTYIDNLFFLPSNIHELDTAQLEKLYEDLLAKYNDACSDLDEEQDKKAQDNIETVNDLLPLHDEVARLKDQIKQYEKTVPASSTNVKTNAGLINFLLNNCTPPQFYCAAYVLRSECDRCLQERYNYKYGYNLTLKKHTFEKPFVKMFYEITNDMGLAKRIDTMRTLSNRFVHKSNVNDKDIKEKIGDKEAVIKYLNEFLTTSKKYKLID